MAALCLALLLCACGRAPDTPEGKLLYGFLREERSSPSCYALELSMEGSDGQDYVEVDSSMDVDIYESVVCLRNVAMTIGADGDVSALEMEVWADGDDGWSYCANLNQPSRWLSWPAAGTWVAGVTPDAARRLLPELFGAGLGSVAEDGDGNLSWTVPAGELGFLLDGLSGGLFGDGAVDWSDGSVMLRAGEDWSRLELSVSGSRDGTSLSYSLVLSPRADVGPMSVPDEVRQAVHFGQ